MDADNRYRETFGVYYVFKAGFKGAYLTGWFIIKVIGGFGKLVQKGYTIFETRRPG